MSDENTKTIRISDAAHAVLANMAEQNHVSIAFLVDFMLKRSMDKLEQLFAQKPKA